MTKEELQKVMDNVSNREKYLTDDDRKLIEDARLSRKEQHEYHKKGLVHPADVMLAKDILSGANGHGVAIDMSTDEMECMEAWAKMIVSKAAKNLFC